MQRRRKAFRREIMKLLITTIASVAVAWIAGTARTPSADAGMVLASGVHGGR